MFTITANNRSKRHIFCDVVGKLINVAVVMPTSKEREKAELKNASVVEAIRLRVMIVPFMIGLAIALHHHFVLKFLIDSLNSRFCSTYSEVKRFEMPAARFQGTNISIITSGN